MEGKKLIHSIRLQNFLSYGDKSEEIKLEPLNVLIGRNASGKSNLIEAIRLLHATPKDLDSAIRAGDGVDEYRWKGKGFIRKDPELEIIADYPKGIMPLRYKLDFTSDQQRFEVLQERIENEILIPSENGIADEGGVFYSSWKGFIKIYARQNTDLESVSAVGKYISYEKGIFKLDESILSQLTIPSPI